MVVMSQLSIGSFFMLLLCIVAAQSDDFDDSDEGEPFDPTMGIVVVMIILVGLFFSLLLVSVYMRRRQEQAVDPGNSLTVRQTARGLDASVIETFPKFRYTALKTLRIGKEALECPVCLSEFEDDEMLRLIPQCCHAFHLGCIDAWLPSHATCPLCRANLVPVSDESVSLDIPDLAGETDKNSPETPVDDIRCGCKIRFRVSSSMMVL